MKKERRNHPYSSRFQFIWMGVALGAVFWMVEAAVHVLVFHDVGFFEQVFSPEPHEVWMRLTIAGMFIGFGIYSQWIVTARWRAERAAIRANTELAQIFDTAADAMRVVDRNFNILRVNETFSALSGIDKEDAVGKKCHEVFWGTLCHTKDCPLSRILGNANRVECDSEKVRKDGVKIPCIVTATPFRGAEGELIGIVEDFKDISERKKSERDLMRSHERLRHRLTGEKQSLIDKINVMSMLIDRTVQSVRRIYAELRPGLLDDFGLSAAIEWEAGEFSKRTDIECDILSDPKDMILPHGLSTAVFRIFQETLTNITRHANATKVRIILAKDADRLKMRVSDNGKGIDEQEVLEPKSFGSIGMRERVHYLGNFNISGNRNGTTVAVTIPIDPKGDGDDKDTHRG